MATYKFNTELAEMFIERMLSLLSQDRPERGLTRAEIEAKLFASKTKVVSYIRYLRGNESNPKRIYICGYSEVDEGGGRQPRYAAGNHQDAKPPGTKTTAQRWAIVKATPEKHERRKAKLRADVARKRAVCAGAASTSRGPTSKPSLTASCRARSRLSPRSSVRTSLRPSAR